MASVIGNAALKAIVDGTIDLNTSDIRAILVMTNTTADTEIDSTEFVYVGDLTTLDEADATGYARIDMAGLAVNIDDANNRAEFDATDLSFTGLSGNATRDYQGVVLYKHVTNDTDSPVLCFIDFASDLAKEATQVDVVFDAEGVLQIAQA